MVFSRFLLIAFLVFDFVAGATAAPHRGLQWRAGNSSGALPQIAGGGFHTCALPGDGSVRCWGSNAQGQLGDGTKIDRPLPVRVANISDAVQVALGNESTCALRASGKVSCWGLNVNGQLGDGTVTDKATPVDVSGLTGAVSIGAGTGHACAVTGDGGVSCWGFNGEGQLGDGSIRLRRVAAPVLVAPGVRLNGVVSLALGLGHSCALKSAGTVSCWGRNIEGQLGVGGTTNSLFAIRGIIANATRIVAGGFHTCVSRASGGVSCWGGNDRGQLGISGVPQLSGPRAVPDVSGVVAIAAGNAHTCVLLVDGVEKCWGRNDFGQLGNPSVGGPTPTVVAGLPGAIGLAGGRSHSCAIVDQGQTLCWGANGSGRLGDGSLTDTSVPVLTVLTRSVSAVALGVGFATNCAARAEGVAACWGDNAFFQGGEATTPPVVASPRAVPLLARVVSLSPGKDHVCALLTKGDVSCWGRNDFGQLAAPLTTASRATAGVITTTRQDSVATSFSHSCVTSPGGEFFCWGRNTSRQIAPLPSAILTTPQRVASGVVTASTGIEHSCWLAGGQVSCRGANSFGQLGDGTNQPTTDAVVVKGLTNVIALATGASHSCALRDDGLIRCWGLNHKGQLGNGTTVNSFLPSPVASIANATAIAAAGNTTCALLANGTARCWGNNVDGQLGNGTFVDSPLPVTVVELGQICDRRTGICTPIFVAAGSLVSIEVGGRHGCALRANGAPVCWGSNALGQLGLGSTAAVTPIAREAPSFRR